MPKCKQCGSTDVAWREGKNGGRYLIDTKKPHFCPKPKAPKRNGRVTFSKETTEAEQEALLAAIKLAEEGRES